MIPQPENIITQSDTREQQYIMHYDGMAHRLLVYGIWYD
jgi:hypothetical protein